MKPLDARPLRTAALAAFLAAAPTSSPRAAEPERAEPALWTLADEDTTITLFGTVHAMRPEVDWFRGPVRDAFDGADELVLETVAGDPAGEQALVMELAVDPDGRALRSRLDDAERRRYEDALGSLGMPVDALDPFEPWMAFVTLAVVPLLRAGYDPELGVDRRLEEAAGEDGKAVTGLETTRGQLGLFDSMDEELQLGMLNGTVAELDALPAALREVEALWIDGRVEELGAALQETMTGFGDGDELVEILLDDRNAAWADWVVERMERPGDVFLAVGAAHLAGDGNLRELLEARGFEIERAGSGDAPSRRR